MATRSSSQLASNSRPSPELPFQTQRSCRVQTLNFHNEEAEGQGVTKANLQCNLKFTDRIHTNGYGMLWLRTTNTECFHHSSSTLASVMNKYY